MDKVSAWTQHYLALREKYVGIWKDVTPELRSIQLHKNRILLACSSVPSSRLHGGGCCSLFCSPPHSCCLHQLQQCSYELGNRCLRGWFSAGLIRSRLKPWIHSAENLPLPTFQAFRRNDLCELSLCFEQEGHCHHAGKKRLWMRWWFPPHANPPDLLSPLHKTSDWEQKPKGPTAHSCAAHTKRWRGHRSNITDAKKRKGRAGQKGLPGPTAEELQLAWHGAAGISSCFVHKMKLLNSFVNKKVHKVLSPLLSSLPEKNNN